MTQDSQEKNSKLTRREFLDLLGRLSIGLLILLLKGDFAPSKPDDGTIKPPFDSERWVTLPDNVFTRVSEPDGQHKQGIYSKTEFDNGNSETTLFQLDYVDTLYLAKSSDDELLLRAASFSTQAQTQHNEDPLEDKEIKINLTQRAANAFVSGIEDPNNKNRRTFELEMRSSTGNAYTSTHLTFQLTVDLNSVDLDLIPVIPDPSDKNYDVDILNLTEKSKFPTNFGIKKNPDIKAWISGIKPDSAALNKMRSNKTSSISYLVTNKRETY